MQSPFDKYQYLYWYLSNVWTSEPDLYSNSDSLTLITWGPTKFQPSLVTISDFLNRCSFDLKCKQTDKRIFFIWPSLQSREYTSVRVMTFFLLNLSFVDSMVIYKHAQTFVHFISIVILSCVDKLIRLVRKQPIIYISFISIRRSIRSCVFDYFLNISIIGSGSKNFLSFF